ncbi:MAG: hypothetical protein DI533_03380 [Cereibacter sphaeroides]|uniref:Outer membrane protein beta-barrel domain-containing protein n=1 Tax=Cereibacter sphaeroides TaxID=1063 RepID=A0A2W5UPH7_CERSP|nr:MAG: hypothetical protein DI533_03380 [Cereibacter sphaeroides]
MKALSYSLATLLLAGTASAQDAPDWAFKATIYGWFPGMTASIDTDFGTFESDSSASDALSDLDMVFMGTFAAQNDRLGFAADFLYTDLSQSQDTPFALYGEGTSDVKVSALSGYVLYRLTTDPKVKFDLGAGFRNFDAEYKISLSQGVLPAASQTIKGNWTDPLIAARLSVALNEKWFLAGFADYGGTGSGDQTYQFYGGVGYAFADNWSTELGYRYMSVSKELDGRDVSMDLRGPVLAVSYSF